MLSITHQIESRLTMFTETRRAVGLQPFSSAWVAQMPVRIVTQAPFSLLLPPAPFPRCIPSAAGSSRSGPPLPRNIHHQENILLLRLGSKLQPAGGPARAPVQPPCASSRPSAPIRRPPALCPLARGSAAMAGQEQEQRPLHEVEQCVTSIPEGHETTCWGCGLQLVFASYSPVFKCGWCGAITQSNQTARKPDSVCFSHWRRLRDRFFVTVLILFMLFVICGGVWAVYPIVFSVSTFCGFFHCTVTAILAVFTITSYCLASFKSAGAPTNIQWGSYPMVGKNDLEKYTFCTYCNKPKPPRVHHCRSCKMCVVDMDHHCPFIGNCVGASNHQVFVIFLISVVISCAYAAAMTIYASYKIWPSVDFPNLASSHHSMGSMKMLLEIVTTIAGSAFFLSARGFVLVYLAFASLSVNAGIGVLLCQQLSYIYEGNTYLSHLNSPNSIQGERGLQNIVRFFGCPYPISRVLLRYSNTSKLQDNSGSKLL